MLEFTLQEVDYGLMYKGEMNIEEIGFTHATIEIFPLANPTNNELVYLCKITKCDKDLLDSFTQIEQKLNELMEVLSDGVVIHENGTITDANSAFLNLLGYSKDETIGKPISKFTNAEGMQLIVEKIAENNEDPYRVNGLHKNGSLIPVELVGKAVVVNGLCQRIVVIKALNED